jgi:Mlc titration factor MtfA (ptsG expression regulator)
MWSRLVGALRQNRDERALQRRAIPDVLWRRTLKRFAFLRRRLEEDNVRLRALTSLFLDRKEFSGAAGFVVSDDVAVAIAAQACLPILHLGLERYDGFLGIVVHRGPVRAAREQHDEDGLVHTWDETLSGEAVEGGPVMLSWADVRASGASAARGYNVVIHEFAHVLDLADGVADGMPALPDAALASDWARVMPQQYQAFCERVHAGRHTALDPYGASAPDEFFAVASEAFFVAPGRLVAEHEPLYDLLQRFYRQNPLQDALPASTPTA